MAEPPILSGGRLQDVLPPLLSRVRSSPDFAALEAHVPSSKPAAARFGCGVAFGLVFAGFGGFWTYMAYSMNRDPEGFSRYFPLFGLLFVGIGLFLSIGALVKGLRFSSALLERRVAGVLDERVHVLRGAQGQGSRTRYYATLLFEGGERQELGVSSQIAAGLAPGDVGVAYLKGGVLLDFRPVAF
jgi:hypothetical protein